MVRHLLRDERQLVLPAPRHGSVLDGRLLLPALWELPVAPEDLAQDGVVRFLRDRALPAGVVRRQVPLDHLDDAVAGVLQLGDPDEEVGVGEVVGVHLEEGASFEDEGGEDDLGQVHADLHLREEVADDRALALHFDVVLVVVVVEG